MKKVHDNVHKRYSDKTMLTIKYKSAQVITSWTPTPVQKFVTIIAQAFRLRACVTARQDVLVFFFGGGVLETRYSQGPWKDFDAKYAKKFGSSQGCTFSGSRT